MLQRSSMQYLPCAILSPPLLFLPFCLMLQACMHSSQQASCSLMSPVKHAWFHFGLRAYLTMHTANSVMTCQYSSTAGIVFNMCHISSMFLWCSAGPEWAGRRQLFINWWCIVCFPHHFSARWSVQEGQGAEQARRVAVLQGDAGEYRHCHCARQRFWTGGGNSPFPNYYTAGWRQDWGRVSKDAWLPQGFHAEVQELIACFGVERVYSPCYLSLFYRVSVNVTLMQAILNSLAFWKAL